MSMMSEALPPGGLPSLDIQNVRYNRILRALPDTFTEPKCDRCIQGHGHCVESLFVVLADRTIGSLLS